MAQDFRKLNVYAEARKLVFSIYVATDSFPDKEKFGLISQLRRAAVSIPTNIAEGCGRNTGSDFARFLDMAYGSACEVDCLLELSNDLSYLGNKSPELVDQLNKISKMLWTLIQKVRTSEK